MPAIQLSHLNTKIDQLKKTIDRPDDFQTKLRELFEFYANWSFRPGELVKKNIHIPQYNISGQILHKIQQALKNNIKDHGIAIELAELLWNDPYFEVRVVAISIIGNLPASLVDSVRGIILDWAQNTKETYLVSVLFDLGCKQLRVQNPIVWLDLIEGWLNKGDNQSYLLSLFAIRSSINDPGFKFIPNIYKIFTEPLLKIPQGLTTLTLEIVQAMVNRLPAETSFFLRQILLRDPSAETIRIVRRTIPSFPKEYQLTLRNLLTDLGNPGITANRGN